MTKREAIFQLHCAVRTDSEIIKLSEVAKYTVYHIVNRFEDFGTSEDRPRSGSPRADQTKKVIIAVPEGEKVPEEICETNG